MHVFYRYFFIFFSFIITSQVQARQACDWPFRTAITVNESSGLSTSNYSVKLTLTGTAGGTLHPDYNWSSNGADLRIFASDDVTPMSFSISSWNATTQIAEVWVTFATLSANSSNTLYVYYGNPNVSTADSGSPPTTAYVDDKIKFHTRYNNDQINDPDSYAEAKALFDSQDDSNNNYGCSHPDTYSGIRNATQNSGGASIDFIAYSTALFTVPSSGTWGVRYGADYGLGGGLYVDGVALDERWLEDLWWSNSWSNPDVLSGITTLSAGEHKLEIIGAEGGNDGGLTIQFYNGSTGTWEQDATTHGITIRSEACPVIRHTIQYGSHDTCDTDLRVRNQDTDLDSAATSTWEINVPQTVEVRIRNTNSATSGYASPSPNTLELTLPTGFILQASNGTDWQTCSQTSNVVTCIYSNSISRSSNSAYVNLTLMAGPTTSIGTSSIVVEAITSGYDVTPSNDVNTFNINVINAGALPAVTPSCPPQAGIWAQFFDTTGYAGSGAYPTIANAADMQTFVDDNKNIQQQDGKTILANINGTANPFNDAASDPNDEYFLTVFEGYIYAPSTDDYTFGVDGDDAIEFWLDGAIASTFYGLHGTNGSPQGQNELRLAQGYHSIEYRMQEHTGGAVFQLFTREGGGTARSTDITPDSYFYHCAGNTDIDISSTVNVESDDINGTSLAKAIPNSIIKHTVTGTNKGNISTDNASTIITIAIDSSNELFVKDLNGAGSGPISFTDGSSPASSGLSYNYNPTDGTGDSLWFSTNGSTFTDSTDTSNDYNSAITHFQVRFDGSLKSSMDSTEPNFSFEYQVRVK